MSNGRDPCSVRLGHAIRVASDVDDAALRLAVEISAGASKLTPRDPDCSSAVLGAEELLKATPRPIYAFVGLLHPELGTVGLIISMNWASRSLQGVSRCDSGGLAGRMGAFACAQDPRPRLLEISYLPPNVGQWATDFSDEVSSSYAKGKWDYVSGVEPQSSHWSDIRAECILFARDHGLMDRRLWSWEARLRDSPTPDEVECLVLSPEMRKRLELLRYDGLQIPASLRVISASVERDGVHWFDQEPVWDAFLGRTGG